MDLVDQRFSIHNINIHGEVLFSAHFGIHKDPSHASVIKL